MWSELRPPKRKVFLKVGKLYVKFFPIKERDSGIWKTAMREEIC